MWQSESAREAHPFPPNSRALLEEFARTALIDRLGGLSFVDPEFFPPLVTPVPVRESLELYPLPFPPALAPAGLASACPLSLQAVHVWPLQCWLYGVFPSALVDLSAAISHRSSVALRKAFVLGVWGVWYAVDLHLRAAVERPSPAVLRANRTSRVRALLALLDLRPQDVWGARPPLGWSGSFVRD